MRRVVFLKRLGCAILTGVVLTVATDTFVVAGPPQAAAQQVVVLQVAALPQSATLSPADCHEVNGRIISDTVPSKRYSGTIAISVYLPPCYAQQSSRLPVIYLLHGANTDQTQWPDLRVQPSADHVISQTGVPFVVVMPGGEYRNDVDYGTFVLEDLMPAVERQYNVSTSRSSRAIGGISMGGYWALKVAFEHPDMFAAVGGHSPVVSGVGTDDPLDLARTASGLSSLRVTLDAGDADGLRAGAAQLAVALRARSVPVAFSVNPGAHNRPYWRLHSEEYLRFYEQSINPVQLAPHCPGH